MLTCSASTRHQTMCLYVCSLLKNSTLIQYLYDLLEVFFNCLQEVFPVFGIFIGGTRNEHKQRSLVFYFAIFLLSSGVIQMCLPMCKTPQSLNQIFISTLMLYISVHKILTCLHFYSAQTPNLSRPSSNIHLNKTQLHSSLHLFSIIFSLPFSVHRPVLLSGAKERETLQIHAG